MEKNPLAVGIAERLSSLQKRSGLSVEAFGLKHGAKRSAQFMYQRGESVPDLRYLLSVADDCRVTLQWLVFGDAVADGGELTDDERAVVERWRSLPPKVRQTVDDVLLLAWLAADSRRQYHADEVPASYTPAEPAAPLLLHEPAPKRRAAAKKRV